MKLQISINSDKIKDQEVRINRLREQMDDQRASGDIDGYNANVATYNNQVEAYNSLITTTRGLITSYNRLVESRNQVALQVTDLAHSIDSKFQQL